MTDRTKKTQAATLQWLQKNEHFIVHRHGLNISCVLEGYAKLIEKPQAEWSITDWMRLPKLVVRMDGQDPLFIATTGYPEVLPDELGYYI